MIGLIQGAAHMHIAGPVPDIYPDRVGQRSAMNLVTNNMH